MLVFWAENLALLAVPKTGSTALEGALAPRASLVLRSPPDWKHAPLYRYRRFIRPMGKQVGGVDPEVMAIVRHPVDWLGSWYRYRHREDLHGHPNSTRGISFDGFVEEYCKGSPAAFAAVGSQARFVTVGEGEIGVQHLYRYEAQDAIRAFLTARLGPYETRRLNASPEMALSLSAPVRARLETRRAAEFEVWESAQA